MTLRFDAGAPPGAPAAPRRAVTPAGGALRDLCLHVHAAGGDGARAAGAWVRACCARVPGRVRIALRLHGGAAQLAPLAAAAVPGVAAAPPPRPPVALALRLAAGAVTAGELAAALVALIRAVGDPAAVETVDVAPEDAAAAAGSRVWTPSNAGFAAALGRAAGGAGARDLAGLGALYAAQRLSLELPGPLCAELAHLAGAEGD